jgi:CDP-6-deoxy-D-xylo-4-hexulose-3-dehydrase
MIHLTGSTISNTDILNLSKWLKNFPRLTKGPLTKEFENNFSTWEGTEYSVMVNSGSSANLLMLYTLKAMNKMKNNKVVVPGLCWITDLSPVIQFGMTPILCDCNMDNLSVDLEHLENIFINESPAVLILVSVLGLSPDMDKIIELCNKYDVILLEDCCESTGTTYKDKKLGSFGVMSSFSFFYGHHMSTIEGGMICTNDHDVYKVLLSIRSHGWNREWEESDRKEIEEKYDINGINEMFTFYYPGFNLRATDLQAFIGIEQLKKIDDIVKKRYYNFHLYENLIINDYWKPNEFPRTMTSNFAYPYIHPRKNEIIEALHRNDIETRPLICGSMGNQPVYTNLYGKCSLENCDKIDKYGIYLPNNAEITEEEILKVCKVVNKEARS